MKRRVPVEANVARSREYFMDTEALEDDVGLSTLDQEAKKEADGLVKASSTRFLSPVILCILVMETAERCVFYGFRALLVLYFTRQLSFSDSTAIALFSYNNSLTYLTPLMGAALADGNWGRYATIVRFGSVYVVGLVILASAATFLDGSLFLQRACSFLGLGLIALGTGGIKPCVSAFGADQVDGMHIRRFFISFYFCINVGSLTGVTVLPIVRGVAGEGWAFYVASGCMGLALFMFMHYRRSYAMCAQSGANVARTLQTMFQILAQKLSQLSPMWLGSRCRIHIPFNSNNTGDVQHNHETCQTTHDAKQALRILPIMAMFPIYWCLYDQQGSVWTLQATRMHLPFNIQPEQLNVINPLQILMFLPLFERVIYPLLESRRVNTSAMNRMSWGMYITAAGFVVGGLVESFISQREISGLEPLNVAWQLPQITLVSIGEILLSITGLEFSYDSSPVRLKALVTALFLCTAAVGDAMLGILYSTVFAYLPRSVVMQLCAVLLLLNQRFFVAVIVPHYQQRPEELLLSEGGTSHTLVELPIYERVAS